MHNLEAYSGARAPKPQQTARFLLRWRPRTSVSQYLTKLAWAAGSGEHRWGAAFGRTPLGAPQSSQAVPLGWVSDSRDRQARAKAGREGTEKSSNSQKLRRNKPKPARGGRNKQLLLVSTRFNGFPLFSKSFCQFLRVLARFLRVSGGFWPVSGNPA